MEWKVIFSTPKEYERTMHWLRNRVRSVKNPLEPIFENEKTMILRSRDISPHYRLLQIYQHWRYSVKNSEKIKTEFTYQTINASPLLQEMWPSSFLSDVTLLIQDHSFPVHRAVLALSSSYFKALFTHMKEATQSEISIKGVNPRLFHALLNWIYGYRISIQDVNTIRLLSLVKRFMIDDISDDEIEDMVKFIPVTKEDLLDYIDALEELYGSNYPWSILDHFFDEITPNLDLSVEDINDLKLPEHYMKHFIENYAI